LAGGQRTRATITPRPVVD